MVRAGGDDSASAYERLRINLLAVERVSIDGTTLSTGERARAEAIAASLPIGGMRARCDRPDKDVGGWADRSG